jgi:hypothetical protein
MRNARAVLTIQLSECHRASSDSGAARLTPPGCNIRRVCTEAPFVDLGRCRPRLGVRVGAESGRSRPLEDPPAVKSGSADRPRRREQPHRGSDYGATPTVVSPLWIGLQSGNPGFSPKPPAEPPSVRTTSRHIEVRPDACLACAESWTSRPGSHSARRFARPEPCSTGLAEPGRIEQHGNRRRRPRIETPESTSRHPNRVSTIRPFRRAPEPTRPNAAAIAPN